MMGIKFEPDDNPEKRKRQISALRAMLEKDKDDFSRVVHQAALDELLKMEEEK